jgi:hypothetical protein
MNRLLRLACFAATCGAIAALLFTVLLSFDRGWREGVPAGIGAGAAFAAAVLVFEALWTLAARLVQSFRRRAQPSFPGETIVKVGEARHVVGIETMLGSLYLTNKALHFRAPSGDAPAHRWRVGLDQVEGAEATRVLGILSSGLRIVTAREAELFVTDDDRGWVRAISSIRKVPVEPREPDQS